MRIWKLLRWLWKNVYGNGQKYIGEFKNGIRHGYGTTFFTRGDVYVGEYNNGKRHGLEYLNGKMEIGLLVILKMVKRMDML